MLKKTFAFFVVLVLIGLLFPLLTVDAKNATPAGTRTLTTAHTGTGTIQVLDSNGYPIGGYGAYEYSKGTGVTVRPYKNVDGWRFDHWILDKKVYSNLQISVTMNVNHNLIAVFVPNTFDLSITCSLGGYTNPSGIVTYPVMAPDYPLSQQVTVTAYPNSGYSFDHWIWEDTNIYTMNPVTVSFDPTFAINYTLRAIFVQGEPSER